MVLRGYISKAKYVFRNINNELSSIYNKALCHEKKCSKRVLNKWKCKLFMSEREWESWQHWNLFHPILLENQIYYMTHNKSNMHVKYSTLNTATFRSIQFWNVTPTWKIWSFLYLISTLHLQCLIIIHITPIPFS